MDRTLATTLLAGGRIALGLAFLAAPEQAGGRWVGRAARDAGTVTVRATGVRDLVLGLGSLLAVRDGDADASRWLEAGIVADVADAASTIAAREHLGTAGTISSALVAAGAAAVGLWLRAADTD